MNRVMAHKPVLQGMKRLAWTAETFHRLDLAPNHILGKRDAAESRLAVDQNGTDAATVVEFCTAVLTRSDLEGR
jgi:hypothetical protein